VITGVAHLCLAVSDIERALKFYCTVLGFAHMFDLVNGEGRRDGAYVRVGGRNFLEIIESDVPLTGNGGCPGHLCLEVDSIEAEVAKLRRRGLEVSDPVCAGDRTYQAWTKDPDGNSIELHQYTAESWQWPWLAERAMPGTR
jgi:catechol 2,3-dioxygenase-like lactoylglutathione lyase family enzyme